MKLRLVTLAGDGIGPEVTRQAMRVLHAVAAVTGLKVDVAEHPVGAAAIRSTGVPLPESTLAACLAGAAIRPRPVLVPAPTSAAPPSADAALILVRNAYRRLEPYWRHYAAAKLRMDPVYR